MAKTTMSFYFKVRPNRKIALVRVYGGSQSCDDKAISAQLIVFASVVSANKDIMLICTNVFPGTYLQSLNVFDTTELNLLGTIVTRVSN